MSEQNTDARSLGREFLGLIKPVDTQEQFENN